MLVLALARLTFPTQLMVQRVGHHRRVTTVRNAPNFSHRSIYGAYGFDRSGGISDDFDRRKPFD